MTWIKGRWNYFMVGVFWNKQTFALVVLRLSGILVSLPAPKRRIGDFIFFFSMWWSPIPRELVIFQKWKNDANSDLFISDWMCISVKFPVTLINSFVFCFENKYFRCVDKYFMFDTLLCSNVVCCWSIKLLTLYIFVYWFKWNFTIKPRPTNQIVKGWRRRILINKMALKMEHPYSLLLGETIL